jgi:cytochrome c biogenesis protein CcmG, thiol:disulfide interchange protein DsbE
MIMKKYTLLFIAVIIGFTINAQESFNNQSSRKQLLNFALLLKHKKNKNAEEKEKLANLYMKLGYNYLAANHFIELGKTSRNENSKRNYFHIGDSLNKTPYKRLYAKSVLYQQAPNFVVEQWIGEEPEIDGKFILIDFWATWCGPCKKAIPELNEIHKAFKDKLAVVGISDEKAEKIERFTYPPIEYFKAIDTQKRMFSQLQIRGIPHVIMLSPDKKVIWEGFPFDNRDPLTKAKVDELMKIFE